MKHLFPASRLALATTIGIGVSVVANSADWTGYRGPKHDGRTEEKISSKWPATGPKVLWKVESPGGFSSFCVANGRAFTLIQRDKEGVLMETLVALNADTGKEIWAKALGVAKFDGGGNDGAEGNKGGDGPRTSPAVDGKFVFSLSGRLVLQCFSAETGDVVWTKDLIKEHTGRNIQWQNAASPVIDGDLVFCAGGGAGESVLAFNKNTGAVVWKSFDEKMTHATPVPATIHGQRQVIFFLQSGLLSVEPTSGKELWRYPFPYKVSTAASPVVAGDIVYCSAGYGVGGSAARISKEGNRWSATRLYFKEGNKPLANHWSTPVLKDGFLYGMFQFKEYGNGPVKCVEVATGNVKWEKAGFGPGHLIMAGNQLVALSDDGQIVVFEANPASYQELARADVLEGKCWTMPVVSQGRIFARSAKEAVCLDVRVQSASR